MIKIANAPCSWGILEFDLEGESAGFEQVLDEMKETGYAGTELGDWGFMPSEPARPCGIITSGALVKFLLVLHTLASAARTKLSQYFVNQ